MNRHFAIHRIKWQSSALGLWNGSIIEKKKSTVLFITERWLYKFHWNCVILPVLFCSARVCVYEGRAFALFCCLIAVALGTRRVDASIFTWVIKVYSDRIFLGQEKKSVHTSVNKVSSLSLAGCVSLNIWNHFKKKKKKVCFLPLASQVTGGAGSKGERISSPFTSSYRRKRSGDQKPPA